MQIIVMDFISLDGVVQAPGDKEEDTDGGFVHGGWSIPFFDPDAMGPVLSEGMANAEALLFGRRTWDGMASAWPTRAGDPYADEMNAIRKYVASRTLTAAEASSRWNNTILLAGDDALGSIRQLRDEAGDGGILVWGSSSLAAQLIENDLVDGYCLILEPILLGGGKTIFPRDGRARRLELMSVTQAKTGTLLCTYRPATS